MVCNNNTNARILQATKSGWCGRETGLIAVLCFEERDAINYKISFHIYCTSSNKNPNIQASFVPAVDTTRPPPWSTVLETLIVAQLINKLPAFFCNLRVHYRVHKSPPPNPMLN